MTNEQIKKLAAAGLTAVAVVSFAACSKDKSESASTTTKPAMETSSAMPRVTAPAMADPKADLVGAGCPDYAELHPSGPASVTGMAQDPVATAASNNPLLSTLAAALSGKLNPNVNLVDTLNNGQYTVFAPTNAAFDKLPASTIEELKTNSEMLSSILTYHVVQGQASPDKVDGTHKTLQGADVTVTGQGNDLLVNNAGLVCGGVHTANATVYMIDTVLTPPAQ
ncbi:MAG: fasciclin domain-containing protein [Mycobacterium sp.]